jgi:fatty-acyl-CoA synthase
MGAGTMNTPQRSNYVTDWLEKRALLTPDRVGIVDWLSGEETTFEEWNARANRTANYLRSLGIDKGELVSVYSSNRMEYVDLFFACGKIGAILHNLNWRLTVHELAGILAEAPPQVLIYTEEWADNLDQLRPGLDSVRHFVAMDAPRGSDRSLSERDESSPVLNDRPNLHPDDPWGIYYTGGTTGLPKGAVMTHGNITWNSVNTVTTWGVTSDHVAALQLPFFHVGGPNIFLMPLVHVSGRTILCREFDLDQTFDLLDRGGITHYVGVPTMFQMIQQDPRWEAADFSKLALVISGGAHCPLPIMELFWDRGVDFKMGYGLTEATGNNFWLPQDRVREKIGSVGIPVFHADMKIIAEDGTTLGPNEEGELLIRGPHITPGYWMKPEATAETIKDGWLHTGDMAMVDDDGCFTVLGRSKDMFISGGENVYPAEVESVMLSHPRVKEAALVGIPEEKWGEIGAAFLVVDSADDFSEEEFLAFMGERVAKYKLPRSVVLLDELPLTAIGKIDKKLLAATGGSP